ncbi:ABC transporter ATP-binding protein [Chelativorans sp. AA-79]|uniref:ABC transporter ATP-binding protein n=1 Tax=Chelativorans sp. AA-79 TaxID=3028735 RepID=UPI0023F80664|nr:ABC transporter ATP-binding protein [Chelativorans sp. AA-79]WEX08408.1 ABC transporter ATP-binding protein [Chelativorans sp. AA-79]
MTSVSIKKLSLSFGDIEVLKDLDLEIDKGEFLVLLGSSGCGKSTLLNCIAGLLDITDGQIFINDRNVTWEQPKDRGIGMVFQSYALYPQMTVAGNLAFGLKNAGVPKDEIERRIARAAGILHIEPLLKRKPAQLSGGQRQRVAIGRALVRDVDVFLFDEPLSNLDAKLRAELRVEIKRLHQQLESTTMIYVTHDQIEAMTLADRIAIMRAGAIQQLADPGTIYNRPINKYVAGFIGSPSINFIDGVLELNGSPAFRAGDTRIGLDRYAFSGNGPKPGRVAFGIRPEHIFMDRGAEDQPFKAEVDVDVVEPMGADTLVWSRLDGHELRFRVDGQVPVRKGERVQVGFDPVRASIFDAETEMRL